MSEQNNKNNERSDRIDKLHKLKDAGINPYPAKAQRDYTTAQVVAKFSSLKNSFSVAGRLRSLRSHGDITFADLQDESGRIQIVFNKKSLGDSYDLLAKYFDVADFVEVYGKTFTTKSGQESIEVEEYKILTKTLRPLPDEHFGFKDEEERLRKRYIDIILNKDLKETIVRKGIFWNATRNFLIKKGFTEVETPVLETSAGGADAQPFVTHHNALDIDVYLRISCGELWQKKLMVAGFEKTFEIGRIFRNEGMSPEHLQDYTQMEFYWAYANYEDGMKLVKKLYQHVAKTTFGTTKFTIGKFEVDLAGSWEKYDYVKTIKKMTGVNILKTDLKKIEKKLNELNIKYDTNGFNLTRGIDNLWKYCRKSISGPGFLVNVPVTMEPLAKRDEKKPDTVQRFQVLIAGSELGKGYSELNDPLDQATRFSEQQKLRDEGDKEAQMYDHDFVEALEHGMPPTCGFGMSERVFSFLSNKTVRECQTFPLVKPKLDSSCKL